MSEVFTKNYDYNSYGILLRDENENLITQLTINDRHDQEGKEFDALTSALVRFVDENEDLLLQLYREELGMVNEGVDQSIVQAIDQWDKDQIVEMRMHEKKDAIEYNEVLNSQPNTFSFYCGRNFGYLLKIYNYKG